MYEKARRTYFARNTRTQPDRNRKREKERERGAGLGRFNVRFAEGGDVSIANASRGILSVERCS